MRYLLAALLPLGTYAGPGITVEIDVFIDHPANPKPWEGTTMADRESGGNENVSCEGSRE
jgi:hypothetical protein